MGTGNADGVFIALHQHTPSLSPLEDRNSHSPGGSNFRIVVVGGGSPDDAVCTLNVFGAVANEHLNTMGPELISRDRCIHVRTGDLDSHALENQTQRTHRDAPNAHQVHLLSRGQKCTDFMITSSHIETPCFTIFGSVPHYIIAAPGLQVIFSRREIFLRGHWMKTHAAGWSGKISPLRCIYIINLCEALRWG